MTPYHRQLPTSRISFALRALVSAVTLWVTAPFLADLPLAHAQLFDVLVIDRAAGTTARGALFRVDPATGIRTLLSDFGDLTQGPRGQSPFGIAVEATSAILVADFDAGTDHRGALFRVDPVTSIRTLLSDFGDVAQGPRGANPRGVAIEAEGTILVSDSEAGTDHRGALFRVDPVTGTRTLLSDFGDPTQGDVGMNSRGVAVEATSAILVADPDAGTGGLGRLFRVDPATGSRTLLSDFGDLSQGEVGRSPFGVMVEATSAILVTDPDAGTAGLGGLFRVDPVTGTRTLLSDFGSPAQGPRGANPRGMAIEAEGTILVSDSTAEAANRGALFRVDLASGARTLLSDFGDPTQGEVGQSPVGVAVRATSAIMVSDPTAGTANRGALFRVDPITGARSQLSDFGDPTQGPLGRNPEGVIVEATGSLLVTDVDAGTANRGVLFRVDPITGARSQLSDFGNATQGPRGANPLGMAVEATGTLLVCDSVAGTANRGGLLRVDLATGTRTRLSDFGDPTQGPLGMNPASVVVEAAGTLLVSDAQAGTSSRGALFRVDPITGTRILLSDFGDPTQGPLGMNPKGIAVEAAGTLLIADLDAGTANQGGLFRVDLTTGARTLLSDFGDPTQGPLGAEPIWVVVETTSSLLVTDLDAGTANQGMLFRVDPVTGARTLLSDFSDPTQGDVGTAPFGVAVVFFP